MKTYAFTLHARDRMAGDGIDEASVEAIVRHSRGERCRQGTWKHRISSGDVARDVALEGLQGISVILGRRHGSLVITAYRERALPASARGRERPACVRPRHRRPGDAA